MIKQLNSISIFFSIIVIILSSIFAIYINKKYPLIQSDTSSCGINDLSCQSEYDISVSGIPKKVGVCQDMVKCKKYPKTSMISNINIDNDSISSQLLEYNRYVNLLSEIGCYDVNSSTFNNYIPDKLKSLFNCPSNINICCKGQLAVCATIYVMLSCSKYNVYSGLAYFFTTKMCKILPTCFDNNDSQPYLLSSVPDFSVNLWTKNSKLRCNKIDLDKTNIKKPLGILTGLAGGMILDTTQAVIYFLSLPQFSKIKYLSFVPYLVASGRFPGMFPNDITFNSLNDGLNMWDIYNRLTDEQKNIWNNGELNIIVILTHNKNIANDIKTRYELFRDIIPDNILNNSSQNKFIVPIFCIPLPAGNNSKYGNVNDPLGRPMFKNGPNKFITKDSQLYDYQKDIVLLLGRCSFKEGYDNDFTDWKSKINTQANIVVLGIENCDLDYVPFELSDQNGYFIQTNNNDNNNYTWVGGNEYVNSINQPVKYQDKYNWKIQDDYKDCYKDDSEYNVNNVMEKIEIEMKKLNYSFSRDIQVNSSPSPFPYYNEKYPSLHWSQSGSDMLQFNVGTFGDNRDTFYPSTVPFCLGKYDVGIIVSQNYMNRSDCINNNDSDGIPIGVGSNSLNIYDQTNQTSFGSQSGDRGKAVNKKVYSMAFSRSDLTCPGNLPDDISSFVFIPTGPHTNLSAPEDTTFVAMSRTYLYNTKPTNFYCTSPKAITIPKFIVKIFSPCVDEQRNPLVCNNISPSPGQDSCIKNNNNSVCANDLTIQSINQAKTFDTLTTDLCTPLRYNKTATKATLGSFIAVFFVLLLLMTIILIPIFIKLPNTRPYIKLVIPIFLFIIILLIIVSVRLTKFNNTTAYIVNQSRKQNNMSNLSDDKSGPLRFL